MRLPGIEDIEGEKLRFQRNLKRGGPIGEFDWRFDWRVVIGRVELWSRRSEQPSICDQDNPDSLKIIKSCSR